MPWVVLQMGLMTQKATRRGKGGHLYATLARYVPSAPACAMNLGYFEFC